MYRYLKNFSGILLDPLTSPSVTLNNHTPVCAIISSSVLAKTACHGIAAHTVWRTQPSSSIPPVKSQLKCLKAQSKLKCPIGGIQRIVTSLNLDLTFNHLDLLMVSSEKIISGSSHGYCHSNRIQS